MNLLLKRCKIILNRCYDKSKYTEDLIGDFDFISFTKEFTYLGSIVSRNKKKIKPSYGSLKLFLGLRSCGYRR